MEYQAIECLLSAILIVLNVPHEHGFLLKCILDSAMVYLADITECLERYGRLDKCIWFSLYILLFGQLGGMLMPKHCYKTCSSNMLDELPPCKQFVRDGSNIQHTPNKDIYGNGHNSILHFLFLQCISFCSWCRFLS